MIKAIVNIAIGSQTSWYHKGQKALSESLDKVGYDGLWISDSMGFPMKFASVYDEKVYAIKAAGKFADLILWLDCSITAIKPLDAIWDYIEEHGVYLYQSGANCAETCNDHSLAVNGITRDEAEIIPECASNVIGINMRSEKGRHFYNLLVASLDNGSNHGEKWPDERQRRKESKDPRFKYHRQDQSSASLTAHLADVKLESEGHFVVRHENLEHHKNDSIIFVLKGGVGE